MNDRHSTRPMRFVRWTLAVIGLLALLPVAQASAQTTALTSCPAPAGATVISNAFVGPEGTNENAQTFTLGGDATVEAVQLELRQIDPGTGDFVVSLFTADGTGPIGPPLATGTFPYSSAPMSSPGVVPTISLTPPTPVVAGQLYAIVVSKTGTGRGGNRILGEDQCDGQRFLRGLSTDAWTPAPTNDMAPFVVLGTPHPQPEPQPGDSTAPAVQITKGPKDKARNRQAKFEFTGTDTRAIASFECSLDGAAFTTCVSPRTVNVKTGKHTFQVRAIDQAGNVGEAATDSWKRKKKKPR
jgi:hypothetical protein